MSAELLRTAAALMRERAEAATSGPWMPEVDDVWHQEADGQMLLVSRRSYEPDAEHIASWHPLVALAVADWLDHAAARAESKVAHGGKPSAVWSHERDALDVACAYLGTEATS